MEAIVYINGDVIPEEEASISIADYGFLFAYGVFGGMRAYKGKVFRLDKKLERLQEAAAVLGLDIDIVSLKSAVIDIVRANKVGDARVRVTVSSGEGMPAPDPASCIRPTVLVTAVPYSPYPPETYEKGFRAIVSSVHRNSMSPASMVKTLNYVESILARREAKAAGVEEAVQLNEKGLVAECSTGNIFLVKNNILKTPGQNNGLIAGITREAILEIAPQLGINVVETDITLEELLAADEAFLTNVMIEVMPLVAVDGRTIGSGKHGEITKKLLNAYRDKVLEETA